MKLLQSALFDKIKTYISQIKENGQIFFYVPYIKTKILTKLVENISNQITIITTWHPNDLLTGSSELELYPFCKENNITLYINNKIHLKVYSINLESGIIASGNISHNGLMPHGNYEVGAFLEKLKIQFFAHPFIQKIDEFINPEAYFGSIKEWVQSNCTDVPVPSRRELTGNVQVLYDWFEKLGDGKYVKDRPNYSERLTKIS